MIYTIYKLNIYIYDVYINIYIYIYIGESSRLPTPSRISVNIRVINKLYIHELLVV